MRIYILLFFLITAKVELKAQGTNSNCASAAPFCTGQTMQFPATTNVSTAQAGPNYGCLGSEPNPAWFFMQIQQSGSISISMSAQQDIDFICWGPFPSMSTACNSLTGSFIQDCSYSASNTETCTISSAQTGSFYIILITNFANASQQITFNQSNANQTGAGNTNCGFVCVISATNSGIICSGQTASLALNSAQTGSAVNYFTWSGPNNFSSTQSVIATPNLTSTSVYTVVGTVNATVNGQSYTNTCQAVTTVSVVQYPQFTITPSSSTLCQGGSVTAAATFTSGTNVSQFTYLWQPQTGAGIWNPFFQSTLIQPPLLPTSVTMSVMQYSLTVRPSILNCPVTKVMTITINNPMSPTVTMPPPLCNTGPTVQLIGLPAGGIWSQNAAVTSTGQLNPGLAAIGTNSVVYSVMAGSCVVSKTDSFIVSKYHTAQLSSSLALVCEQDPLYNLMNLVIDTVKGKWTGPGVSQNRFFNPNNLASGIYNLTYSTQSTPVASVCPASTVLAVQVFNPPSPTVVPIPPKCTNSSTVSLSASPSNGTWSGNSGITVNGVYTPSLSNNLGTNLVSYAAGIGTCVATSAVTFHVSHYNTGALSGTINPLCVTSAPVNLMAIVQSTTGTWTGINVNNNVFNPATLPTNNYTLSYNNPSNPDPLLCPGQSQLVVHVLNLPVPAITPAGPFCSADEVVQLSVTPPTGKWVSNSYLTGGGLFSPSLAPVGTNIVQYIIGTPSCNTTQTALVKVEAFVPAALNAASLPDLCNTSAAISLAPYQKNNSGGWVGPGLQGHDFNPGISGAGKFVLTYTTASVPSGLCPDQSTLSVQVFSLAAPNITKAGPFCTNSAPEKLSASPVGGIFGTENPAMTPEGLFRPSGANIGENVISYSIASGPCIAFTQHTIQVHKFISASLNTSQQLAFCDNQDPVNLYSYVINTQGTWEGSAVNGGMFDPGKGNPGMNNTVTYRTQSFPDPQLCPDERTMLIRIDKAPAVSIPTFTGCAPAVVKFNVGSMLGEADWNLGDGSVNSNSLALAHTYTSAGSYSVTLSYTLGACRTTHTSETPVTVFETPHAAFDFTDPELSIASPEVQVVNRSTPGISYSWSVHGQPVSTDVHPVLSFSNTGTYRVDLKVTNQKRCWDETSKFIEVRNDFGIYVPDAFTPNYDGINDRFVPVMTPYGLDATSFEMEIYDRWGELILRTTDINKGWDGTLHNEGENPVKQDVYVYIIKYRDKEGKGYKKTGSVTLLQ